MSEETDRRKNLKEMSAQLDKVFREQNEHRTKTNYCLTINGHQAALLQKILDVFVRVSIGDFGDLAHFINYLHKKDYPRYGEDNNFTLSLLRQIQRDLTGFDANAHYGVGHPNQHEDGRIAIDIEQVLRKCIADAEQHPDYSVWHHDPLKYSQQPLPKCEVKK